MFVIKILVEIKMSSQNFDSNQLYHVKQLLGNNSDDEPVFPKADYSSLNAPITREEVRKAIYKMKNGKASCIDEITAEVLMNDTCIDILYKIIFYCFSNSEISTEWSHGIINPIHKSDCDPRDPLGYRPLISVLCKVYA